MKIPFRKSIAYTLGLGAVTALAAYPLVHSHAPKISAQQIAPPPSVTASAKTAVSPEQKAHLIEAYGKTPLFFERNQGQTDPKVKYLARGQGYAMFLTQEGAVLAFSATANSKDKPNTQHKPGMPEVMPKPEKVKTSVLRMKLAHANPHPSIHGEEKQAGISRYYSGNDAKKWVKRVSHVGRVHYDAVYPGIDLAFYGNQKKLEYDFIVKPGADPKTIAMRFTGADAIHVNEKGQLVLAIGDQKVVQHKPVIYQEIDGEHHPVEGGYVLRKNHEVAFRVASYDTKKPLIIDPVLVYSTYLGGSVSDYGHAIAVDSAGNAWITGNTFSTDFPTLRAFQSRTRKTFNGYTDAFVTKFSPTGQLLYSTYLGGGVNETGYGIAIDSADNAYVTGWTSSANFPLLNAVWPTYNYGNTSIYGYYDAFVTKLSPYGTLIYSTYLGGNSSDSGRGIAVDSSGNAYITGLTLSSNFPRINAFQYTYGGGANESFVTKLDPAGRFVYSTYLGGNGTDQNTKIAVDSAGNAYVSGQTTSTNFPMLNAIQPIYGGSYSDAFVTKITPTGALAYSTYLGGTGYDAGLGIAADSTGNTYVTGWTSSADFPTQNAFQPTLSANTNVDAFVTKLDATGQLAYSTYLGGSHGAGGNGITVDSAGNAYIAGSTTSANFPMLNATQPTFAGGVSDVFITELDSTGQLAFSTYLGGSNYEFAHDITTDNAGNVYVTGATASTDFPTLNAAQPTFKGGYVDAFVAKIQIGSSQPPAVNAGAAQTVNSTSANGGTVTLDASGSSSVTGGALTYIWTWPGGSASGVNPTVTLPIGTTTVTLTVTDSYGNSSTSTVSVTVKDTIPPVVNAPASVTVEATGSVTAYDILSQVTSSDNYCPGAPDIYPIGPYPPGVTKVIVTVTDCAGNATSVTVDLNVVDTTPPVIATPPAPVTFEATGPQSSVTLGAVTATDLVNGTITATSNAPATFPVGTTIVTYTVTDAAGNVSTVTRSVTVTDTTAPVIATPPAPVTMEATGAQSGVTLADVIATDLVSGTIIATSDAPATFPVGTTIVHYTAVDAAGNVCHASRTVTIADTTPPAITAPAPVTVEATAAQNSVTLGTATATDLVDGAVTVTSDAPATFPVGTTVVTWTAIDAAGNTSTVTQTVTVTDSTPPTLTVPAAVTVEANAVNSSVAIGSATATDLVDGAILPTNDAPAGGFPIGTTVVTWSAADTAGNTVTATQNVTVVDTTPPVLTLPAAITAEANAANSTIATGTATATDIFPVTVTSDAPATFPLGTTTVTWTATDANGNTVTGTQTVTVVDTTPPAISAPAPVTVEATGPQTGTTPGTATATDLVDGAVAVTSDAPATFPVGTTVVTWSATDAAGNTATATQNVTVVDTTPPAITLPADITVEATGPQNTVVLGTATAVDLVDGAVTVTNDAPATFPVGTTIVTYTATDAAGNTGTATQTVTVTDTTPPTLTLPTDVSVEANAVLSTVNIGSATATDLVDGSVVATNDAPATFPIGTTVVTWSATDAHGNTATATQNVTVVDTTPPALTVPAAVTAEANAVLSTVAIGTATATDIFPVTVTSDAPATYPLGTTTVTWTATDANGNATTAKQTVTVVDTTPPVLTLPADVSIEANGVLSTVNIGTATATDIFGATVSSNAPAAFPVGTTVVTWTATDPNGNSSTGTQKITVVDTTPPAVTARLVPVKLKKHEGDFRVVFSASDIADPNPAVTATLNGVTVTNGQIVELKAGKKVKIENEHGELEIRAPSFTLNVSATDFSGNTGTASDAYAFPLPQEDHDDSHSDNGIHRGNDKADHHTDSGKHKSEGKAKIGHKRRG